MEFPTAKNNCFNHGGYIFSPYMNDKYFLKILVDVPQFARFSPWWTSLNSALMSTRVLTGDGTMVLIAYPNNISKITVYNASNEILQDSQATSLPAVCEKSAGILQILLDIQIRLPFYIQNYNILFCHL